MSAVVTRTSPADMLRAMSPDIYKRAYKRGQMLSAFLEEEVHGDDAFKPQPDGYDAFERLLMEADIKTRSFADDGIFADEYSKFDDEPNTKALVPEWVRRVWRSAATGKRISSTRAVYSSDDTAENTLQRPRAMAAGAREDLMIAPAIPVNELVAITTPVNSAAYTAFYLTNDAANQRMVRVGETAEIPTAKLTSSEKTIRLLKYGRALEGSYEALRRQRIDMIALHIARMAVQSETDKIGTIMGVLVNGDGGTNTAAEVFNLTTLDATATAGILTAKGWLAFQKEFEAPYVMTTILMQKAPTVQVEMLSLGTANLLLAVNAQSVNGANLQPINRTAQNVRYGWTGDAPTLKVVAFDRRFAIERVVEIGGNVQEIDRFVKTQTELFTMTEVENYAVIDPNAAKILDINA
jgi:hypothetical protein